jgi:hypothetical protein
MAYRAERTLQPSQKEGVKARAQPPALNPESCAIVQPYKDFLGKGYIRKISVVFDPMGVRVTCLVQDQLLKEGETKDTEIAVGDAKNRIIEKGLWTPKQGNKVSSAKQAGDSLPLKTLCKKDFEGKSEDQLKQRVLAVAKALGDTTARGRIGSLKMMIEGVDDFDKWWNEASASEKTRLLSDKKHHDTFSDDDHLTVARIIVKCPFRGSVPTPSEEEEEEETITQGGRPASGALVPRTKG